MNPRHGSTPASEACDGVRSQSFSSGKVTILRCVDLTHLKSDALRGPSRKRQRNESVEDLEGVNDDHTSETPEGDGDWHQPLKLQVSQG